MVSSSEEMREWFLVVVSAFNPLSFLDENNWPEEVNFPVTSIISNISFHLCVCVVSLSSAGSEWMSSSSSPVPCIRFTAHAPTSVYAIKLAILDTQAETIENAMVTVVWMKKAYLSPFIMPIEPW